MNVRLGWFWLCSLALATSMADLPEDVIVVNILRYMYPLSIAHFGMACKSWYRLSQWSMETVHNYLSTKEGHLKYDVEILYDSYQYDVMEDNERSALERLILAKLPPPTNDFETSWYRKYKDSLFADEKIGCGNIHISGKYIELCRMIIKHKIFFQHNGMGVRKAKYIDLALQQSTALSNVHSWRDFAIFAEPYPAYRLAEFVHFPTLVLQMIRRDWSLNELLMSDVVPSYIELYLIFIMANRENYGNAVILLKKFTQPKLSKFFPVLFKHGSTSLVEAIRPKYHIKDKEIKQLIMSTATHYQALRLYELIRGRSIVGPIFRFLGSFDPITKEFSLAEWALINWNIVMETAVLFFNDEDLIETLMKVRNINGGWHDFFVASTRRMSTRLTFLLLENLQDCEFEGFDFYLKSPFRIKVHLTPLAVDLMIRNRKKSESLYDMGWDDLFRHAVSLSFDLIELTISNLSTKDQAIVCGEFFPFIYRAKQGDNEVKRLVQHCLRNKIYFRSCPKAFYPVLMSAFDLPLDDLLDYIPQVIGEGFKLYRDGHYSSVLYAAANVMKRPGGLEILTNLLKNNSELYFLRMIFDSENVDLQELVIESARFEDIGLWIENFRRYQKDLDAMFQSFLNAAKEAGPVKGCSQFIKACLNFSIKTTRNSFLSSLDSRHLSKLISDDSFFASAIVQSFELCELVKDYGLEDVLLSSIDADEIRDHPNEGVAYSNLLEVFNADLASLPGKI